MKKRILSILLLCCMVLTLLPTTAFAAGEIDEQFILAPGGTYYFDLSAMGIPGTVNDALPDKTMRYVPFTYAGTVDSYKLTSEMATTEEYAQQSKYAHSLFIADFAVTHEVSWDNLNAKGLIFGKNYTAGGVSYTLRAPSVGSDSAGSGDSQHGTPQSNEWDRILDKNDGYIKNWSRMHSWGQDISRSSWTSRAVRGYSSARFWGYNRATRSSPYVGFRPVLEILNPGTLGSDGLKAVTLDLGGGKLGGSSEDIQIIVKKGSEFTAPASDGLTRPEGNTDSYYQWLGSDGKLYAPGDSVPADVIKLTAQFDEQFTLTPGGVYYFDLSGVSIPGTANGSLPDKTMHYVPFTYAGTVDAYKLTSEMATTEEYAEQKKYAHSLFVADYAVTHAVSWDNLNAEGLIFGKGYATGSVDYTLRAPSGGSGGTGSGDSERGTPQSNEWDRILDKDDGYIKNWRNIGSWGQDTLPNTLSNRVIRGRYDLPRKYAGANTTLSFPFLGFRPVLEVLNPGTLGSDGLKAVTLDLGGGKLGGSSDTIQIIVKTGESFTAPASEGLTRPDGNTGSYFEWLGSDGELYAPDDNVPADVTKLTAQFVPPEQFNLAPDGTYYFDLSGVSIPGTANGSLPDKTMHYVPFTYAGTVDAYKLTSEMATTEEYAEQNKYAHSLFVADYTVTHTISWNDLNTAGLIFGKDYTAGGVDYTMRAPSEGSDYTGSGDSERGTPQSNEWDRLLDKDDGYIKNWNGIFSCGQDTVIRLPWRRTVRGHYSSRFCGHRDAAGQNPQVGFRPVLEVLNRDTIGPDGLKTVTLDLGGGKLGDESSIRIIVKNGSEFTAPASDGLTRPEGATGNYFKWLGSDGKLYAPGDSVPEDVTTLTARFVPDTYTVIVTTDSLPDGKTGKAYSHTLTAIGAAPITWSIDEGALPAGLRLNEKTGEISGILTAAGTATFTVKAENSEGSDTRALSITVNNAVEQTPVRYLDADGKERFCTEYTVLERVIIEDFFNSDNKWYDMPAGWYVVEGDVTITPRLDTHGAVNLILKDDCHLTVPWGINVKEGDTFTIYAQSTAEASMGKLTACLPELSDHEKSVWPVAGLSGIGAGVRVWAANDNYYENEGTIIINGGNIHAKGQQGSSAIGGSDYDRNVSSDGDTPGNLRQGGSITINGGVVRTEPFALPEGNPLAVDSVGIGTCQMGYGGGVTINGGVIHAVGKGGAAGIGSKGDIRITGGELTVSAEGSGAAIGGFTDSYSERVDCKSITINGNAIKSISSKDGACIGGAAGGSVGSITISDAELPLLSSEKVLIGWDADSPGGKLTIRNCRVESTDIPTTHTDGIRVGSNSEIVIENGEIRLPHLRGIRVGGNGSIAIRDSDLHTYGIFMDETVQSPNDAKTLKKLEITDSIVLTGDIIGARGEYSSVEEIVIRGSSIRLNDEYTYNRCTIGGGEKASFGSIDIQDSQIDSRSSVNAVIGNGTQSQSYGESRIRIANSQVSVRNELFGPAIGAAYGSSGGQINILIENSTVTAKGGNLRSGTDYIPGIGKNSSGRASEIGKIQILNSTVESFRLEEKDGTNYVYDKLHTKELPGIPAENITICGSTVNGKTIDHSPDEYGKCALCDKYDLGYCYEHGLLTLEGLTDCAHDGSEKKLTGLSHQTGENKTKQLTENTDYTAIYSNNVHPYTLTPGDEGFDSKKAPKVTLYGTGNYCGKAEHYFTISTEAPAAEHTVTVRTDGNGTASASYAKAAAGTEITLTATPNEGYHFKEWEVMSGGVTIKDDKFTMPSANVEVKAIFEKDAPPAPTEFTITVRTDGNGTASASHAKAVAGTEITLTATPNEGYRFKEWQVISGGVTIKDDKFLMPNDNVEVKAIFEEDAPPVPTDPAKPNISVTGTYTYNGSVHTATVNGYDLATMDISGNTGTDAGDYTVSVTSKTGKWVDGSTDAVTAAWSIGKATREAPDGLIGVAPITVGGSDGKISGVTDKMEYRMAGERSYTACSGTEIDNLSAGNYFVRYAEDNNHFASTDAEVTVGEGTPLADCTITFSGNGGSGSMGPVIVKAETNYILPVCGFTAPTDQEFKAWEISGTEYKVGDTYTVSGDTEIKALWENSVITPTTYTVTVSNDGNGTGTATPSTAATGTEITLTAMPKEGYHFKEWQVISGGVTIKNNKFLMPNDNVEVKAIFEKDAPAPTEYTITYDLAGGTAEGNPDTYTIETRTFTLKNPTKSGYTFTGWSGTGLDGENNMTVTIPTGSTGNRTYTAHWRYNGSGHSYSYYTIKATAGAGGSISPSGNVSVREGRDQTFTITPDKGYAVANVKIDGKSIGAVKSYTFENVSRTHTIEVIFMKANGNPQTGVFVDVATGSYYEDAVDWAVENGITKGTDDTHFSPDGICTRAQAVTFLWRTAGSPASKTSTMPFTDVPVGSYYYDAVLWAVENGITKGTSDTTFSPNMTCSRAQIVTFLWRSEKSPTAGTANPFADVKSTAYYADAVLWAVKENITKGTTSTTFSPNADCTRAQIVTFLWRCKK